MKRKIRLKEGIIGFPPGDYEMNVIMSEALVQRGKAVYIDNKQEKKMIETKEEKFTPINKRKRKKK